MHPIIIAISSLLIWTSPQAAEPVQPAQQPTALAPGYASLPFPAPKPGSYQLPEMGSAADGTVLDSDGKTLKLHDLYGDKVVLVSALNSTENIKAVEISWLFRI